MGSTDMPGDAVVGRLLKTVREISKLPECRNTSKKMYGDLVRRVKLLNPLFEELRDSAEQLRDDEVRAFESLRVALGSTKALLRSVNESSKVYQALKRDEIVLQFHKKTEEIEEALNKISLNKLDLSEEVQEQIQLLHAQFGRAKGELGSSPDAELEADLAMAGSAKLPDPAVIKRLAEKLQLRTMKDLEMESLALRDTVISSSAIEGNCFKKASFLLELLNDLALTEKPDACTSESVKILLKHRSPIIPNEFRCPISLELMKDPVVVSSGQTYERSCIKKWLDAGHRTCPKTQQTLWHTGLTPNYAVKSLITVWCESNGVQLGSGGGSGGSDCDRAGIDDLLEKLACGDQERERAAAAELRLLAKRNAGNRICIAEAGAIPLLVQLVSSPDPRTQEHAVTALLNLSINEANKGSIVSAGAIPDIVDVLVSGGMEARENAAATLFSLSVLDENKVKIGMAGAIPALVDLLCRGTPRGKKDAATAVFNLAIHPGNRGRVVRAGIVGPLMGLVRDGGSGMGDEALAILAVLAGDREGRAAIGGARPVPVLVDVVRTGPPRSRENAAAVLYALCTADLQQLYAARDVEAEEALRELCGSGTDRAKRKAGSLVELLHQVEVIANL